MHTQEKFLLLAGIFLFTAIAMIRCRKDSDSKFPIIDVQSPVPGSIFNVGDTIRLMASCRDDRQIKYLQVTLIDSEKKPVLPSIIINSPQNPYTLSTTFIIGDSLIESGTYELQFQVSDGTNTVNSFVKIQLIGLPKRFLYPIVISRPLSNELAAYAPDSSGQWNEIYSRQGDYIGTAVNSPFGYIYISGACTASLDAFNLKLKQVEWSIPSQQPSVHRWFESVSYHRPLLYVSYFEGYIKGFDISGVNSFTTVTTANYFPKASCLFNDNLAAALYDKMSGSHALAIYYLPGGSLKGLISPTPEIVALFQADKYHLICFGNQSGNGVIQEYDNRFGTLTLINQNINDSIFKVSAMDGNNYIFSGKSKLYWYSYAENSLVDFISGIDKPMIACETVAKEVYVTTGLDIDIYSFPGGVLQKTIITPGKIVDLLLLYNK